MITFTIPTELPLSPPVRQVLLRLANRPSTAQQVADRARLILEIAEGGTNDEVAERMERHPTCVRKWRNRWMEQQATFDAHLDDEKALSASITKVLKGLPSPGTPPTFTPEQVAAIIALACEPPEVAGVAISNWSHVTLAEEAVRRGLVPAISPSTVGRFLKSGGVKASQGTPLAQRRARRP